MTDLDTLRDSPGAWPFTTNDFLDAMKGMPRRQGPTPTISWSSCSSFDSAALEQDTGGARTALPAASGTQSAPAFRSDHHALKRSRDSTGGRAAGARAMSARHNDLGAQAMQATASQGAMLHDLR